MKDISLKTFYHFVITKIFIMALMILMVFMIMINYGCRTNDSSPSNDCDNPQSTLAKCNPTPTPTPDPVINDPSLSLLNPDGTPVNPHQPILLYREGIFLISSPVTKALKVDYKVKNLSITFGAGIKGGRYLMMVGEHGLQIHNINQDYSLEERIDHMINQLETAFSPIPTQGMLMHFHLVIDDGPPEQFMDKITLTQGTLQAFVDVLVPGKYTGRFSDVAANNKILQDKFLPIINTFEKKPESASTPTTGNNDGKSPEQSNP